MIINSTLLMKLNHLRKMMGFYFHASPSPFPLPQKNGNLFNAMPLAVCFCVLEIPGSNLALTKSLNFPPT